MTMIRKLVILFVYCTIAQTVLAQSNAWALTDAQKAEIAAMMATINHPSLAWRAAVTQKMLAEASYFADRLKLPTPHPIRMTDIPSIQYPYLGISPPWFSVIHETNPPYWPVSFFGSNIYNASIPREERLRTLKIGANGTFETTNFVFYFADGKLREITHLSEPQVERYAHDLDQLVGKPSLIETNSAHQLATQWLAAVEMDMAGIEQLKWTVHQLHYKALGATNYVTLPLYYVHFGNKHFSASGNLHAFDEPLVSVEILGTTKELQDITINDPSFSRRPLLLITNAIDLVRRPNPPVKRLQSPLGIQTNSPSP